ncbi:hypothetical protein AKJ40_04745 [candidate division MSBL1 archaeon SCGC-AAA259M10]|uniref:Helicase C-terminal domain-containing protein n=2 Tax=candidate division MSBL1 TaxID=215777 RepID=A0A133V5T6_9EURY|nr:hypothetical protein AKJ40_04745 [candidate division MSBL1 archaeon SCGC-AAA259M10]KXB01804.1 hypothetical protein AKJ41_00045 [candidate division MSBL1 archaeon SCGC-AAA259O05]
MQEFHEKNSTAERKGEDTKASSLILKRNETKRLKKETERNSGSPNPKLEKVHGILQKHFRKRPKGRAMVFAEYRDTVESLTEKLNEYPNLRAEKFIGQAGSEGMTQKEQKEILERFDQGEFDILVSTSIVSHFGLSVVILPVGYLFIEAPLSRVIAT